MMDAKARLDCMKEIQLLQVTNSITYKNTFKVSVSNGISVSNQDQLSKLKSFYHYSN